MSGQRGDALERMDGTNFGESDVYTSGMLAADVETIKSGLQLISPRAQEVATGNNTVLGPYSVTQLLPYDRLRVRASIIVDGIVRIGNREEVTSGGGFLLPANVIFQIQTVDEVWVGTNATQQTVSRFIESDGGDVI